MALTARLVHVPPDPLALARRVASRRGAAFLWSATGRGPSYVACEPIALARALDPEPRLAIRRCTSTLASSPRWIGVLPYEAVRAGERPAWTRRSDDRPPAHFHRPLWLRYRAVAQVTDRVLVVGDDDGAVRRLAGLLGSAPPGDDGAVASLSPLPPEEEPACHARRIRRALELIAAGDLYQVNLARRMRFRVAGRPVDLLARMSQRAPAPYGAALSLFGRAVVGTSPELFLALEADRSLWTAPIKGTRPRGIDARTDATLARELDADPKERAELTMILDVERNDLGRVARTGSVRVVHPPRVAACGSVLHRGATLRAVLRPELDRAALLEAMLPSGSVTGAPKVRAMEVIAHLEPHRRGLYTGAYGFLRHDGGLQLAMAIRVLTIAGDEGHYFAGGGIVADSDAWREVDETEWKSVQVTWDRGAALERTGPRRRIRAECQNLSWRRVGR